MTNYKHILYITIFACAVVVVGCISTDVFAQKNAPVEILWDGPRVKPMKTMDIKKLIPHKATYTLKMMDNHTPTKLSDIYGQMNYHFVKTCQSWVTDQKLNLEMIQTDGIPMRSVNHFFSDERFDGKSYHYTSENVMNKQTVERSMGAVFADSSKKGKSSYSIYGSNMEGKVKKLDYKSVVFPIRHLIDTLSRAKSGENIHHATVFDGSFAGDPVSINAVTSQYNKHLGDEVKAIFDKKNRDYLSSNVWSISYAYFKNDKPDMGEEVSPDYESMVHMMDNGIITELTIKYPDFVLKGMLTGFEPLDSFSCP